MSPLGHDVWAPYCGAAPVPAELLGRWNFDPILLAALVFCAVGLWREAGQDGRTRARSLTCSALVLALFLFVSPFCALTSALFSARVVHHVLLTALLAPLIAFSLPRGSAAKLGSLAGWTAVQAVVFWVWHWPALYAAALSNDAIYWLMQSSLLTASVGFWVALRRCGPTTAVGSLLATMVQMGLLGALITFAGSPLYAPHTATTLPWGLTPLQDQQLAGLIMWAPAAALYLAAALLIAARWLKGERQLTA